MHAFVTMLALIAATSARNGAQDPPNVLRAYDITASSPITQVQEGSVIHTIHRHPGLASVDGISPASRDKDFAIQVMQSFFPGQWELPDHEIGLGHDGRMLVRAPQPLQDAVAASLAFMTETFGRPTRLVIDVITTKNADASMLPALMPAGDTARWIAGAIDHESYDVTFLAGERGCVQAERALELVRSYAGQIAERAVMFQPLIQQTSAGLSIECATAPAPGGSWIALSMQDVEPAGDVQNVDVHLESRITTDSGIIPVRGPSRVQRVQLDERICALNAFLPDGKALVLHSTIDLGSERATRIVFIHQEGPSPAVIARLPENLKRAFGTRDVALVRADAYVLPRASAETVWGDRLAPFLPTTEGNPYARYLTPSIQQDPADDVSSRLSSMNAESSLSWGGPWAVLVAPTRAEIDSLLAGVSTMLPEPRGIQATLTLKRGSRSTSPLAQAVLPLRLGAKSTIVLGTETSVPAMTEANVAQGATITSIYVCTYFNGIAVGLEPRLTSSGDLLLQLEAHARAPRGALRQFDAGTPALPVLEQQDADLLDVERTVTFAKASSGPKRVVLGNAGSSAEALTLEIEVVDLR